MLESPTMAFLMKFSKGLSKAKMTELLQALPTLQAKDAPRSMHLLEKAMRYSLPTLKTCTYKVPAHEQPVKKRKKRKKAGAGAAAAQGAAQKQQPQQQTTLQQSDGAAVRPLNVEFDIHNGAR